MFEKAQQLNDLRKMRSQAMDLQKKLKEIRTTLEYRGIEVTVNGEQRVEKVIINGSDDYKDLVEAINKAMKEVQKKSAKKMMEDAGGLSGLLKGF